LGETLVVLMVAGNILQVPQTLLEPVRTLTANVALAYAVGQHQAALFFSGLVLMLLVLALALFANRLQAVPLNADE
jgi:phosphate transport system permease protein